MRADVDPRIRVRSHGLIALIALGIACGGLLACGARTAVSSDEPAPDGAIEAMSDDAVLPETLPDTIRASDVARIDGPPLACEDGLNLTFAPSSCSTSDTLWFAYPFRPKAEMSVTQISVHTDGGDGPGLPLFVGALPDRSSAIWRAATITPALHLAGGKLYYLAARSSLCSQTIGGVELTEYMSTTVGGPWEVPGVGSFTARLEGSCP